eukprot:COSAG01_NODE_1523_length_10022_cov_6.693339_4_plen_127_part_00
MMGIAIFPAAIALPHRLSPPLMAAALLSQLLLACAGPNFPSSPSPPTVDPAQWFACRPGSGPCDPKPRWAPTYVMAESTSMQVCNFSGYQDPASIHRWGLIDFDWCAATGPTRCVRSNMNSMVRVR